MNESTRLELMKLAISMAMELKDTIHPLESKDSPQPRNMPPLELVKIIYKSLEQTLKDST